MTRFQRAAAALYAKALVWAAVAAPADYAAPLVAALVVGGMLAALRATEHLDA